MRKKILFISQNRHLGEALRSVLSRNSIEVVLCQNTFQMERFIARDFDIILFEELFGSSIEEMMAFFGIHSHLRKAERWMIAPKGATVMERIMLKKDWKLRQVLTKPVSPLDILEVLRKKKKAEKSVSLNSLRLVSQIWANRSSMVVKSRKSKVIFIEGSLVSHSNFSVIQELLEENFLRPSPISMAANKNNFRKVGQYLLSVAIEKPPENWLQKYQGYLSIWPKKSDLTDYLLSPEDLARVQNTNPFSTQPQKDQELLYGLWKMGIIKLEQEELVLDEEKSKKIVLSASEMKSILQKDLDRLKNATPLEVLGLASGAGLSEIMNNSRRLEDRYRQIKLDYPHQARDLVPLIDQLLELVQSSAKVLSGGGYVEEESLPEHEQLYQYGMRQIKNQNWIMAEKALTKASQMRIEDGKILAAKGWAEFNNPDRDEEERRKDGLESLLLAIHLDKEELNTMIFIAKAYLALGDPENALGPIKKASTLTPAPEVQELRSEVERRIQKLKASEH